MKPYIDQPESSEPKASESVESKLKVRPDANAEPKPTVQIDRPFDLAPQIAVRAYELYEKAGRREGHAVEDWDQAERGTRNDGKGELVAASDAAALPKGNLPE